jgi:hypothetical protein
VPVSFVRAGVISMLAAMYSPGLGLNPADRRSNQGAGPAGRRHCGDYPGARCANLPPAWGRGRERMGRTSCSDGALINRTGTTKRMEEGLYESLLTTTSARELSLLTSLVAEIRGVDYAEQPAVLGRVSHNLALAGGRLAG